MSYYLSALSKASQQFIDVGRNAWWSGHLPRIRYWIWGWVEGSVKRIKTLALHSLNLKLPDNLWLQEFTSDQNVLHQAQADSDRVLPFSVLWGKNYLTTTWTTLLLFLLYLDKPNSNFKMFVKPQYTKNGNYFITHWLSLNSRSISLPMWMLFELIIQIQLYQIQLIWSDMNFTEQNERKFYKWIWCVFTIPSTKCF